MENFIELIKAFILGVIQGITEWLPISSTGHMKIFNAFWPMTSTEEFTNLFIVFIQIGSVLAVLLLFFKILNPLGKSKEGSKNTLLLWVKIVVASLPAAVIGLLFDDLVDQAMSGYMLIVIASTLIIYGFLFIYVERKKIPVKVSHLKDISFPQALAIGAFQTLAIIPGTSRSGATIVGSLWLGLSRTVAAEFSFMLSIPVLLGWGSIKFIKAGFIWSPLEWATLAVGFITAFIVSLFVMKLLMNFVRKHNFTPFALYRIALGLVILALVSFQIL
ncbi:MAG: undecaprenyl-diphosphate phosphatase [Erysipelotrichaceae bacterium]|nr:undecaprenyl-diphosphate phosphatase [Erysipelotrichaceae bacterium]